LSGVEKVTVGSLPNAPVTLMEFDVSPDFTFWHAAPAGVEVEPLVGDEELQAARPPTRRAAAAVAVRALREVRTVDHPALSAFIPADSRAWERWMVHLRWRA
jgi:hypothetical protein